MDAHACLVASFVGRSFMPMVLRPTAIAPELTRITSLPPIMKIRQLADQLFQLDKIHMTRSPDESGMNFLLSQQFVSYLLTVLLMSYCPWSVLSSNVSNSHACACLSLIYNIFPSDGNPNLYNFLRKLYNSSSFRRYFPCRISSFVSSGSTSRITSVYS